MSVGTHLLPLLRALPPSMDAIKTRFESFSYTSLAFSVAEFTRLNLPQAPRVALLPFTSRTSLERLREDIKSFFSVYPDAGTTILGLYSGKLPFRINDLYAIGLKGFFQAPLEEELLINKVCELAPITVDQKAITFDQLIRVNIIEIERSKVVPYDLYVYLPVNRKTILYLERDSLVDEKLVKKFKENSHYNLYIRRSDLGAYREHARQTLKEFSDDPALTALEKSRRIAGHIGGLIGGFFAEDDFEEDDAKQMLENLKAFVKDLADTDGPKKDLEEKVTSFAAQKLTSASHSQNVAAYCALFGLALGLTEPETLRIGGLLHDVGLGELPPDIAGRDRRTLSPDDLSRYQLHPNTGKMSLVKKKIQIPKASLDMVLYHHEHADGSGYPFGLKAEEIPPYAKVCAFADEFDKLTSIRPGYAQLSPAEAIKRIAGLDGKPAMAIYDARFHGPLVEQFLRANDQKKVEAGNLKLASVGSLKGPVVSLARLLKTSEFAKPDYLPQLSFQDRRRQEAIADLSEQLDELFKRRVQDRARISS